MYKVYWTCPQETPCSQDFGSLTEALEHSKYLRNIGRTFVTMVSQDPACVSKPGVDEIKDGVLPDGTTYDWKKRRS